MVKKGMFSNLMFAYRFLISNSIIPTQGPLTTSRSGLELFMKTYLDAEPWVLDTLIVPIPWRPVTLPPRLKIAVMWTDDIVTPHPPVTRALKEVAAALDKAGIELVDWVPEGHDECWNICHALYFEDGGKKYKEVIKEGGEEMLPLTKWLLEESGNVKYQTVEEIQAVSKQPS